MATSRRPLLLLSIFAAILCSVLGNESAITNQEISRKLLKHLTDEKGSKYEFSADAEIIETQLVGDATYFLAELSPRCRDADDPLCIETGMVCQGSVQGDQLSEVKCFLRESDPPMPQYKEGYLVKNSNNFITKIVEESLQKLQRDTGRKRKLVNILSVKKRETLAGTEVFITSKVTAGTEGNGDVMELENCELAATLGTPGSMQIMEMETKCFALSDDFSSHGGNGMITADELKAQINWAVDKINFGTDSVFNFTIAEIVKAEESITPGSGGMTTSIQLKLASTLCPKNSQGVQWKCEAKGQPIFCSLSTFQRPWKDDILLSRPHCKLMPTVPIVGKSEIIGDVVKRPGYCTGCLQEVNKEDEKVTDLAKSAVTELNAGQLSANPHKLVKVVSAHRQVINGVRYVLNLELTPCIQDSKPCTVTSDAESSLKCRIEIIEGAVDRKRRLSSSLCQPLNEVETTTTVAEEVTSSSPQELEIYSDEDKSDDADRVTEESVGRAKRSNLLGSPEPIDLEKDGDKIKALAEMALKNIDDIDDDVSRRKLIAVVEAKKQVVNGILYHLSMRIAVMPPCDNGQNDCMDGDSLPTLLCKVQVHQAPADTPRGKPVTKVMRSECEPEGSFEVHEAENPGGAYGANPNVQQARKVKRSSMLVGAPSSADLNDPQLKEIADFAVLELDKGTNALYHRTVVNIVEAKTQVVAGTLYHLKLELGFSDWAKNTEKPEKVNLKADSNRETCDVKVWDRPWLKERQVTNFTCSQSTSRSKRSLGNIGGGSHDIHMGIFLKFIERHGKRYDDEVEFRRRFHIFRANMKKIQHLQETEQGSAKYGPTRFADMTSQEFKRNYLGLRPDFEKKGKLVMKNASIPNITLPDEFDWRNFNAVTPVKNQGQCGSCWAFSVTGNVEGQWAIHKGQLLSLSEQELVDCDSLDNGCNGGLPSNAYESIMNIGGLESETDYPYDGKDEKCHFDKGEVEAKVTGALNITTDEEGIAKWLVKNGPVSIGINANAMQFYYGGVSHPLKFLCNPKDLDHGVLIVGFGVHTYPLFNKTLPFWSIKNSWGPQWGEQGYYRVYRGDGTCGVNMMATSAIVE
ncbi:uncharacterized protein LOC132201224 isoform X2 [Neocloeon triangulifer]|uniref:uncharacterized protein LOC132201224 isoform X2 n=1 Tax=Neocloeon triangulifer TaxID=2078957 RepID=UPI00286F6AE7|nr:uncharacterized protein LOC132201224 isoform X2 [Neocloeon triangulifer]